MNKKSAFEYELYVDKGVRIRVSDTIQKASSAISEVFSYPVFIDKGRESDVYLLMKDLRENYPSLIPAAYKLFGRVLLLGYKYERSDYKKETILDPDEYLYSTKHRKELTDRGKDVIDHYNKMNKKNDIKILLREAFVRGQAAFADTYGNPQFNLHIIRFN